MAVKHYLDILSSFLEEKREGFSICESSLQLSEWINSILSSFPPVMEMTPLKHLFFFNGVFRSHYLIKVPFYLGSSFLFVSDLTRDFPISLRRLQAGLAWGKEREERRQKSKWQLVPWWRRSWQVPRYLMGFPAPLGAIWSSSFGDK